MTEMTESRPESKKSLGNGSLGTRFRWTENDDGDPEKYDIWSESRADFAAERSNGTGERRPSELGTIRNDENRKDNRKRGIGFDEKRGKETQINDSD